MSAEALRRFESPQCSLIISKPPVEFDLELTVFINETFAKNKLAMLLAVHDSVFIIMDPFGSNISKMDPVF